MSETFIAYTNRNQSGSRTEVVVLHQLFGDATLGYSWMSAVCHFAFSASHPFEMFFYCPKSMPSKTLFLIQFSKSMSRSSTVISPILSSATLYKTSITSRHSNYGGCTAGVRGRGSRTFGLQWRNILWRLWARSRRKIRSGLLGADLTLQRLVALNLPNHRGRPIGRLDRLLQRERLECVSACEPYLKR